MLQYHINQDNNLEISLNVPVFIAKNKIKNITEEELIWRVLIPPPRKKEFPLIWENPEQIENYNRFKPFTFFRYGEHFFASEEDNIISKLLNQKILVFKKVKAEFVIKVKLGHF